MSFSNWLSGRFVPSHRNSDRATQAARLKKKRHAGLVLESLEKRALPTGTWTALANPLPDSDGADVMVLLSDGTVMVKGGGNSVSSVWHRLTPDSQGHYSQGTWTTFNSMNSARLYFASNILQNGNLLVVGGEYSGANVQNWINTAEEFDPQANNGHGSWTTQDVFPQPVFGDEPSETLPDGRVLTGGGAFRGGFNRPVVGATYFFDPTQPAGSQWSFAASKVVRGALPYNDSSDEENWVKLPDGSILTYDNWASFEMHRFFAERYIPAGTPAALALGESNVWIDASQFADPNNPPSLLTEDGSLEIGNPVLLPDGRVWWASNNGVTPAPTDIYDPSTGLWSQGPSIPNIDATGDLPTCMMPNGDVLFAGWRPTSSGHEIHLLEYDPSAALPYTDVTPSDVRRPDGSVSTFHIGANYPHMLMLPDGNVLVSDTSGQLAIYSPGDVGQGNPNNAWRPTIDRITPNIDGSFRLTGTQLTGLSEGAGLGDDAEMSSNYPIVRVTDLAGQVKYARTSEWSSTGVATGSTPVTTTFQMPAGDGPGTYYISVIANGIASTPVLAVFGSSGNDTVTVGATNIQPFTIPSVNVNGVPVFYDPGAIAGIDILAGGGNNTVNIQDSTVPVNVEGKANDTVNIGSTAPAQGGTLSGLVGPVNVINALTSSTAINVDDSGDTTVFDSSYNAHMGTLAADPGVGFIAGMGPLITFDYFNTTGVTINTSHASGDVFGVWQTGVPTTLTSNDSATVNVGDGNGVQDIQGTLTVDGVLPDAVALNLNDQADGTGRTVTMSTGNVSGLAPADINYGPFALSDLNVNGGTGTNAFDVQSTPAAEFVPFVGIAFTATTINCAGTDTVNVGDGNGVQDIQGSLTVNSAVPGFVDLNLNDQADREGRTVTMASGSVGGLAPAEIDYGPLSLANLNVNGGSGTNTFDVQSTPAAAFVPQVGVVFTLTTINCAGGDTVNVGDGNGVQDIEGSLTVNSAIADFVNLNLNDQADRGDRTVTMATGSVSGLAPADIDYGPFALSNLNVNGGTGTNTFDVQSTPAAGFVPQVGIVFTLTAINCAGSDTVNVGDGNGVQDVQGTLTVNSAITDFVNLNLNDQRDSTGRTVTMATGSVTGLASAAIDYGPNSLSNLNVYTGTAANTVNVDSTPAPVFVPHVGIAFTQTNIIGGGLDAVVIGGTGRNTQNISGPVNVTNPHSATSLVVDDSYDTVGRTVTLTNGEVSGLSPADVTWTATPTGAVTGGMANVQLFGGTGNNTFDVNDTDTFYQYAIIAPGAGTSNNNAVNVRATTAPLLIVPDGGTDLVTVGSLAPALGGSLDAIHGYVDILQYPGSVTSLVLDDQGTTTDKLYDITATQVNRSAINAPGDYVPDMAPILYSNVANLTLYGASAGWHVFTVESTSAGTATAIYGGSKTYAGNNNGLDEFLVSDPHGSMDGIQGPLALHGHSGSVSLASFGDYENLNPAQTYTLTAGGLGRTGIAPITFDGMVYDAVSTSEQGGGAVVNVLGTAPKVTTYVGARAGDTVTVGKPTAGVGTTLDGIQGPLVIEQGLRNTSEDGPVQVVIDDSGDRTGRPSATISTGDSGNDYQLTGLAFAPISLAINPASPVSILGGLGDDTLMISVPVSYTGITVDGGQGTNTLVGPDATTNWTIAGANTGTTGAVGFSNMQNLTGGSAGDTFAFRTSGSLTGNLSGGGGANTLDYSAYVGDVTVDLPLKSASRVGQATSNIANVTGSQGNDILVGDGNVNMLIGGTGRNVIIGGAGADQLFGGSQDNILIGGYTKFDQNLTALQAILAEWTSADTYSKRVKAIGTGVTGTDGMTYALVGGKGKPQTVFDDGATDVLTGSANPDPAVVDWLFVGGNDQKVIPNNKKDTITPIF